MPARGSEMSDMAAHGTDFGRAVAARSAARDLRPMKATVAGGAPGRDAEWVHEVKWDGMRVLVRCVDGETTLTTTNGLDATAALPRADGHRRAIGCDAVLDGEVVADRRRRPPRLRPAPARMHLSSPDRGAARRRRRARRRSPSSTSCGSTATTSARCLARSGGPCSSSSSSRRRRGGSHRRTTTDPACSTSPTSRASRAIVSKRIDSTYLPGKRTTSVAEGQGPPPPGVRRRRLVARREGPGRAASAASSSACTTRRRSGNPLRFAGKVGTGFTAPVLADYERPARRARHRRRARSTRRRPVPSPARPTGCAPRSSSRSSFGEWTADGVLRHPSHLGRRDRQGPRSDVVREPILLGAGGAEAADAALGLGRSSSTAGHCAVLDPLDDELGDAVAPARPRRARSGRG